MVFAKAKVLGYNGKASILPNELAVQCTLQTRGNKSIVTILRENQKFHDKELLKTPDDSSNVDDDVPSAQYSNYYAVLVDNWYSEDSYQKPVQLTRSVNLPVKHYL